MDLQLGIQLLDLLQDQRHRVVAGIHDPHPQTRRRNGRALRGDRRPVDVRQDLPRVDQQHRTGRAQPHVVGGPFQQDDIQFPFQPLQLLTQRGLADVFAGRGPAEMQLLGQGNEVTQLPKLQAGYLPSAAVVESRRHVSVVVADEPRSVVGERTPLIMSGDRRAAHDLPCVTPPADGHSTTSGFGPSRNAAAIGWSVSA